MDTRSWTTAGGGTPRRSEAGALQRLRGGWVTFGRLSRAERGVLVQSWVLLPLAGAALRLFGTQRVLAALACWSAAAVRGGVVPGSVPAEQTARLVESAAWLGPYRAACLPRSLVTWCLLQRSGIPAELRIGVRFADARPWSMVNGQSSMVHDLDLHRAAAVTASSRLQAHAWVEARGCVISVDAAEARERFAAFEEIAAPTGGDNGPR